MQAYTDVGLRAVIAPAVADRVFYQTVPDLLELLPTELRRTVESLEAAPTQGLLHQVEGAIRQWNGAASGRILLEHGHVRTVDAEHLRVQAQEAANRLRSQNSNAWALAAQLRPYVSQACRAAVATPLPINRYAALPSHTHGSAKES